MTVSLHVGDCREVLARLDADSLDACVTDPPYDLTSVSRGGSPRTASTAAPFARHRLGTDRGGFMGKTWDGTGVAFDPATWAAVLRVLKPGAHLVAFGGTRTSHRMVCAIEDAGFEIRDGIEWLYGTGFPKSITPRPGLGTALKPAHEPICLARKPFAGRVVDVVGKHGTGALNVEACRVCWRGDGDKEHGRPASGPRQHDGFQGQAFAIRERSGDDMEAGQDPAGRWPPNVLLTHAEGCAAECVEGCPVREIDEQSGDTASSDRVRNNSAAAHNRTQSMGAFAADWQTTGYADAGGASRFFPTFRYEPKASREERDAGLDHLSRRSGGEATDREDGTAALDCPRTGAGRTGGVRNHHPTVKPVALMRWLVRLVTPPGGTVLDPFAGSGTTGVAAVLEARGFVGVEMKPEYVPIIEGRIAHAAPLFAHVDVVGATQGEGT